MTMIRNMPVNSYPEWLSDEAARKVYDATLSTLKKPTLEQLEMLAAYADAYGNLRRLRTQPEKARVWRGAMLYARNGLGLGAPTFIDLLELIIDSGNVGELGATAHLNPGWQLPETARPEDYLTTPVNY